MLDDNTPVGLTFDDVVLVPARSNVLPNEVDTRTMVARTVGVHIPIMSAAMGSLTHGEVARGSTTMSIVQQAAGSVGTAVMSVVLTNRVFDDPAATTYTAVMQGEVSAEQVPPAVLADGISGLAGAFGYTFTVAAALRV